MGILVSEGSLDVFDIGVHQERGGMSEKPHARQRWHCGQWLPRAWWGSEVGHLARCSRAGPSVPRRNMDVGRLVAILTWAWEQPCHHLLGALVCNLVSRIAVACATLWHFSQVYHFFITYHFFESGNGACPGDTLCTAVSHCLSTLWSLICSSRVCCLCDSTTSCFENKISHQKKESVILPAFMILPLFPLSCPYAALCCQQQKLQVVKAVLVVSPALPWSVARLSF